MSRKIIAGNWKMNTDFNEAKVLASEIKAQFHQEPIEDVLVILCPPFPFLESVRQEIQSTDHIALGAQNCHEKQSGAYTGEVSAEMVKSVGSEYVIIGHSERRAYFRENHGLLAEKVSAALHAGLKVIFCCGEQLQQRENNSHLEHIEIQLKDSLFHLSNDELKHIIIAYEPVWAIGTGKTATPEQAQEMHNHIRHLVGKRYNVNLAQEISILYGGSCKPSNAREIFAGKDVDGGLIGGASLKASDFIQLIHSF